MLLYHDLKSTGELFHDMRQKFLNDPTKIIVVPVIFNNLVEARGTIIHKILTQFWNNLKLKRLYLIEIPTFNLGNSTTSIILRYH